MNKKPLIILWKSWENWQLNMLIENLVRIDTMKMLGLQTVIPDVFGPEEVAVWVSPPDPPKTVLTVTT